MLLVVPLGVSLVVAGPAHGRRGLVPSTGSPGMVYAWGAGGDGQLGNGVNTASSVPVGVSLPAGVAATAVSEGDGTSYAVGSDRNIYAWGAGGYGQLGDGTTSSSSVPVQVSLPSPVAVVSGGHWAALAITSDGSTYAWGDNSSGQLGNGTTTNSDTPVKVALPPGVTATAVSEGYYASLAVGSDGHVYAWGDNSSGQLGNGTTGGVSDTPVQVSLAVGVAAVAVAEGDATSLAVGSDGKVYAWGSNNAGQLGNGTTGGVSDTPVQVSLAVGVAAVAVAEGDATSLAVGSDGKIYAWGSNNAGQLGNGTTTSSDTPLAVQLPGSVAPTTVAVSMCTLDVVCGGAYDFPTSMAVGADGNVYTWGHNGSGVFGNGSTQDSSTPVKATLPAGVSIATASEQNETTLALATSSGGSYPLSVAKAGGGAGTVTSSPAGISCGSTCAHAYASGTQVTLSAAAASGSTFAGWSGAGCAGTGTCAVTMSGARAVTVTFNKASSPKACIVPKVKGKGLKAAKHAIKAHNCSVGKIKHSFSGKVKKGRVISQKPKPGKRLKHGAKVNLVISKGP